MATRVRNRTRPRKQRAGKYNPSAEEIVDLYRSMYYMRRFEIKVAKMYLDLHIWGFAHLYIGQEAVAAGVISSLREDDYVMSNYRDHAHYLMKGGDPRALMAELFGKETGTCRGKGGSMHIFDPKVRFLGGYAIVAGGLPIALGTAYSIKYKGEDQIVAAFFGDGATNSGTFYEVMNMAKVWKLPMLFVCENNFYGIGTRIDRVSAVTDLYKKAEASAIPGEQVDGMDVFATKAAALRGVEYVRSGNGPYFIEALTWRFRPHSMTDHDRYRDKEEKKKWEARDPIPRLRELILNEGILTEAGLSKLETEVQRSINVAVDFAMESPFPAPEALFEDVYA